MTPPPALTRDQLFTACNVDAFAFTTTDELEVLDEIVGQKRATEAVRFAIGMRQEGYNLFAFGRDGTGKSSLVLKFLERQSREHTGPDDWVYVNNFCDARRPQAIRLPAGRARLFAQDMEQLVEDVTTTIRAAFGSDEYRSRQQQLEDGFTRAQERSLDTLREGAAKKNVAVVRTPMGVALAPIVDGEVVSGEDFQKLPPDKQAQYTQAMEETQGELSSALRQLPAAQRQHREALKALDRDITESVVGDLTGPLAARYDDVPDVRRYLQDVHGDVVKNAADFRADQDGPPPTASPGVPIARGAARRELPRRYEVNVMVGLANGSPHAAPVIQETHPTQPNLVGRIEHQAHLGALVTDFTMVKPGALHRANGGYLVLDARKLLTQPFAYDGLKRALVNRSIQIESPQESAGLVSTMTLEPEPIPLDVKVVLLGEGDTYYTLNHADPEFRKLFKVAADFDDRMDRTDTNAGLYARLVATVGKRERLLPLDAGAVARVVEYGARLAENASKLSTHMGSVVDLVREADYWARDDGAATVGRPHVQQAIDAKTYRADSMRERVQEQIQHGTVVIECAGERVGEVNGLAVYQMDHFTFGKPSRISCRVRLGRGDVIDIEREVQLGGPLHTKGVLILSSYLSSRYAEDTQLSLSANLVFEQSYGEVDGDSASSTELYALISALADIPLKQNLAVTGSVDQRGRVQAIGGVNEKIEGFFDVCQARGLTGDQGVLIPASNIQHLMLREDVVAAAEAGSFHVYPVTTIDEGLELLTGRPAGERDEQGEFPLGSVNRAVIGRLHAATMRSHAIARGDHPLPGFPGGDA